MEESISENTEQTNCLLVDNYETNEQIAGLEIMINP